VHLAHELSHQAATDQLPDHVSVAWDGLSIQVTPDQED
jgi:hypothetical protein